MSFEAWLILIGLTGTVGFGFLAHGLWTQVKAAKAESQRVRAERDQYKADLAAAHALAGTTHKIEETRNERKDAVASGGFAGSLGVLHDVASRTKPKT